MKRTIATVLLAAMLVLAGCSGGVESGTTAETNGTETTAVGDAGTTTETASMGTVNVYVSDERNAIDQFEHLNVTITKVGFEKESDESETDAESSAITSVEANTSATANISEDDLNATATTNASVEANTSAETNVSATDADEETTENDAEEKGGWTEYDVDERTVDLTQLQGAKATGIGSLSVEEGSYTKVFVYVSEVEGTLETGETVNVKLPSNKLQLEKGFSVKSGESVDFVYDITVVEAGKSGKFVLKPVVGESGTSDEVDIDVVDENSEKGAKGENGQNGENDEKKAESGEESSLEATFVGTVAVGENVTVRATENGTAVADATVTVNGETVGTTDENGELTLAVPEGATELEVTVTSGDDEVELDQRLSATVEKDDGKRSGQNADALV